MTDELKLAYNKGTKKAVHSSEWLPKSYVSTKIAELNLDELQYEKLNKKTYDKLETVHHFVVDAQNTTFSGQKNAKPNIEIEDLIYPEIILELSNEIFSKKKGFKKINEKKFLKKTSNQSLRFNGILEILDTLKNEANPDFGLQLSTKDNSFKGGISNLFVIKGNQDMIEKIQTLDVKYPEVKKFLTKLMNA